MIDIKNKNIDTLCVQAGYQPKTGEPRVAPIVQSTTFYYEDPADLADLFDLRSSGYFYTRLSNPTCSVFEEKVAALEGAAGGALSLASGQSASLFAVLNVCGAGDRVLSSSAIYGGTYNLFHVTLRRLGIETDFVPPDATPEELDKAIRPETKLIFGETVSNPSVKVLNFKAYAAAAKKHGILFAVDNTLATPIHCRPLELGAHVVVHSSSKYLDGHAVSLGGVLVSGGNFDFTGNPRYPLFNTPDESYHGLTYATLGAAAYIVKARVQLLRDAGAVLSPFNAFLANLGTETLHLRMARTSENALKVAEFLAAHPAVAYVKYPFLKTDSQYEFAKAYLKGGAGGMLSFGLKGGRAAAEAFIKSLKLCALVTHVADVRSSVIHPASTTHRQLSETALVEAGVPSDLIRFSAGIENAEDILADLAQALKMP